RGPGPVAQEGWRDRLRRHPIVPESGMGRMAPRCPAHHAFGADGVDPYSRSRPTARLKRSMKPIAPICAAGLREARAYLERARSRCQDVATPKVLELVVARIEEKSSETD